MRKYRVFSNGGLRETTVYADSMSWDEKCGRVLTFFNYGPPLKNVAAFNDWDFFILVTEGDGEYDEATT